MHVDSKRVAIVKQINHASQLPVWVRARETTAVKVHSFRTKSTYSVISLPRVLMLHIRSLHPSILHMCHLAN